MRGKCCKKIQRRKANWIGHILLMNCLLKHVNEGKIQERSEGKTKQKKKKKKKKT